MYHPPSRRRELTKRIVVYSAMSVAVLTTVTLAVLYMMGYRFNTYENQVEQGGLVQFISQPRSAQVHVDAIRTATRTNDKLTLLPGDHTIRFTLAGYHDWNAEIQVVPGRITWVNYARMIPTELRTQDALRLPSNTVDSLTASDRERTVLVEDDGTIQLVDLGPDTPTIEPLAVPDNLLTFEAEDTSPTYTVEAWDTNRYALVKATAKQAVRWVLVDVEQPDESQRISVPGAERIADVQLVKNGTAWYVLADNRLYYGENDQAARVLAADVARMSVYDNDTVLYVSQTEPSTGLQHVALVHDTEAPVVLFGQQQTAPLLVTGKQYFNKDYVAIATSENVRIFAGDLPDTQESFVGWDELISLERPSDLRQLEFGPEGRFIVLQSKKERMIYDIEWARLSQPLPISANEATQGWLDNYLLWNVAGDTLQFRDFGGHNVHELATVEPGFDVTLAQDGEVLYSVRKDNDQLYLQRTELRVE